MFDKVMSEEEMAIIDSQKKEALLHVQAAKIHMFNTRPFYGSLVGALHISENHTWCNTMATDGANIYYSAEFVMGMTPERRKFVVARMDNALAEGDISKEKYDEFLEHLATWYRKKSVNEICFVLEHEVRHVICDHLTRGKAYNHDLYNRASDYYINSALVNEHSQGKSSTSKPWFTGLDHKFDKEEEFGFILGSCFDPKYFGWHSEDIYVDLLKNGNYQQQSIDQHVGRGGGSGGKGEEKGTIGEMLGTDKSGEPKLTEEQQSDNADRTRGLIKNAAQAAGDGCPEEIRNMVKSWGEAKIDYKKLLRRTLTSHVKSNPTYRRLAKRGFALNNYLKGQGKMEHNRNIALPSYSKDETIDVYVLPDVSGSITEEQLRIVYKEILGLTKQYTQFRVTLFCWSTECGEVKVYTHRNIKDIFNYKVTTTGGTDIDCVFEKLDELRKGKNNPSQNIIFTDGYFSSPEHRKDWEKSYAKNTLWIISQGWSHWKQPWKAGKSVNFDEYVK